jgi:hypothetical protein
VPTPFQHLVDAEAILAHPALPAAVRRPLQEARGAFLLGSTAADVRAITGQHRSETHFYRLSEPDAPPAGEALLAAHPTLADPRVLRPAPAAFVSGYLVHLAYDERWAQDLFLPLYWNGPDWYDRVTFTVHHNALRVHLDRRALTRMLAMPDAIEALRRAEPAGWLPFVPDDDLREWRDWLVAQLDTPDQVATLTVFAERMGVPVDRMAEQVARIEAGTYDAVPGLEAALDVYAVRAQQDARAALLGYWETERVPVRPELSIEDFELSVEP